MMIKIITISGLFLIHYIILIKCSVQIDVPSKSNNKVITTTTSTAIANTTAPSTTKTTTTTQSNSTTTLPPAATTIQSASISTTSLPTEINNSTVHNNNNNNETINTGNKTEINELSWRKSRRQHIPENYYCHCDLKINYCDINCCCDIDCSNDERKTFICRENHWSLYDYDHFSGLQSCQIHNSLFCVVHDDTTIEQIVDYSLKNEYKYKWPQMFQSQRNDDDDHDNDNNREYYKSGDSLLVYDEINEKIQTFNLPYSLTNDNCQIAIPIQHLSDNFQTNCLRTIENLDKFLNDFQREIINLKFLTSRKQKIMENCINCIHIKMYNCKNIISTKSCAEVIGTVNDTKPINELELDTTDYAFINTKILINFNHNFTNILNCSIYFLYQNFTITDFDFDNLETNINNNNNNNNIIHKIIVKFFEQNETIIDYLNNKSHNQISGNIGYLKHYPIIKTKLIEINETLIDNISNNNINNNNNLNPIDLLIAQQQKVITRKILEYFSKNISGRNNQFLKIPIVLRNGICQLDQFNYDVIRFGENLLFKCFIEMQSNNTISITTGSHEKLQTLSIVNRMPVVDTTTINFTKICIDYQQQIYYYLINHFFNDDDDEFKLTFEIDFITKLNLFISEFGNPKNNLNYWHLMKIKNSQTPKYLLDQIYGESIDADNEFICHNIILTIDYEFLYGHLNVDGVPNQLLLKEISLNFGTQLNLKFKYDNELMKIPIYLNVMFLDITSINNYAVTVSTSVFLRYYHLILLILMYRINK